MKIFLKGKYYSIFKINHQELIKILSTTGIITDTKKQKSNVGHINIDGFSIRTILKPNNEEKNASIFLKDLKFPTNINFRFASEKYFNITSDELNRVRTLHLLINKSYPLKIRALKDNLNKLNETSTQSLFKKEKIILEIKEIKSVIKEHKIEFKYSKKIAYRSAKILIPSIYIIKKKKEGVIQAKWTFLGIEQKRIHLGMVKNIGNYNNKKLRNLTIKIIKKKYKAPFDKLTFTWINKENTRLRNWQETLKKKNLIYKGL